MRALWSDPEWLAKHGERFREAMRARSADPAFQRKAKAGFEAKVRHTPEYRRKIGERSREWHAKPGSAEKRRAMMAEALRTRPELRDHFSEGARRRAVTIWGVFYCPPDLRKLYAKLCRFLGWRAAREAIREDLRRTAYGDQRYQDEPGLIESPLRRVA